MAPGFTELPAEIIEAICLNLDPQSLICVAQTCRFVKKLTVDAPLIWRHFCHTHFRWWDPQRAMDAKFAGPLSDVDWRSVFVDRLRKERDTRRLLNSVLATQQNRTKHIDEIASFGYDVKGVLLQEMACAEDEEDGLARRYYATAILERVQREMAIDVWASLHRGGDVPLEKALAAYDIFTRTGEDVDFENVTHDLDELAKLLRTQHPEFDILSARAKASTMASFLRDHDYCGVAESSYRALRNSFIGLVLRSETHDSLPLISVAIYCALARRVGLDARPCGFIFHVYCLVYAPKDYTLDGAYKPTSSSDLDYMYLDPFRSSDEVNVTDLQRTLREMGVPPSQHAAFLSDSPARDMVTRTARNIMSSVQTIRQAAAGGAHGIHATWFNAYPDMDNAFYATIWVMLILGDPNGQARRRQYLPYLLEHFQTHYPWDLALLVQHIIPMFIDVTEGARLTAFADSARRIDGMRRIPKPRDARATQGVRFRVGQLFRHRRYRYEAVITGWDTVCDAGEEWIHSMGVDQLPGGRNQSFYHAMCCDKSLRYVAEENIVPCERDEKPSEAMLRIAGRHFKRWDVERGAFVSNVKDEYPDD